MDSGRASSVLPTKPTARRAPRASATRGSERNGCRDRGQLNPRGGTRSAIEWTAAPALSVGRLPRISEHFSARSTPSAGAADRAENTRSNALRPAPSPHSDEPCSSSGVVIAVVKTTWRCRAFAVMRVPAGEGACWNSIVDARGAASARRPVRGVHAAPSAEARSPLARYCCAAPWPAAEPSATRRTGPRATVGSSPHGLEFADSCRPAERRSS